MAREGTAAAVTEEPAPEGATWVVRDPEGRVVDYSTEPIVLEMTTQLGEALGLEPEPQED